MSDNEILFIIFVCLSGGYLIGRAHAFAKTVFNDVHTQDNKQEIALAYIKNQELQIEQSIKKSMPCLLKLLNRWKQQNNSYKHNAL